MNIKSLVNIDKPMVLASKSPRRKFLLEMLGLQFEIVPSNFEEENVSTEIEPAAYVKHLAEEKAKEVANRIGNQKVLISADTIVVLDNKIINKPYDKQDAFNILSSLSDNEHYVYSGVSLKSEEKQITHYAKTKVRFRDLSENEIWAYIETGSPMDKAGAYGIQDDFGALFVKEITGCYYNIVGFPLETFYRMLKEMFSEVQK